MPALDRLIQKLVAEAATGVRRASGHFQIYSDHGERLEPHDAADLLWDGETVEVPSAGAGSYTELSAVCALGELEPYETSSSAGDWLLRFVDEEDTYLSQTHRYPFHGYRYRIIRGGEF